MPTRCYTVKMADGAIALVRGNFGEPCGQCNGIAGFQCDYPIAPGRTCDAHMCEDHAHEVGENLHYCPRHCPDGASI